MKSHLKSTIALSTILVMSMLSVSCGTPKITEYETKHESGTYIIATFEDIENLTFPKYTPLETVAGNFTDFCYYNRPLAKLNGHIKVTNTSKQRKPERKSLSPVSISF